MCLKLTTDEHPTIMRLTRYPLYHTSPFQFTVGWIYMCIHYLFPGSLEMDKPPIQNHRAESKCRAVG